MELQYSKIIALKTINNNEVIDAYLMLFNRKIDVISDNQILIAVYSM